MTIDYSSINGWAIFACVAAGQFFLTLWFAVFFAEPWAKAYGAADKKQHTAEIPLYTYTIGAACVLLLSVGLALLQAQFNVSSITDAWFLGLFVAFHFSIATALPGYAFLKRWPAFLMALGSQSIMILVLSSILVLWP